MSAETHLCQSRASTPPARSSDCLRWSCLGTGSRPSASPPRWTRWTGWTPPAKFWPDHDTWETRPNGDRCCSFCGSLHPDDWLRLMKDAVDMSSETVIDPTDKGYKFYVRQKGVKNASEGGIKFYTWHIPSDEWAAEANALHPSVIAVSRHKNAVAMQDLFGKPS